MADRNCPTGGLPNFSYPPPNILAPNYHYPPPYPPPVSCPYPTVARYPPPSYQQYNAVTSPCYYQQQYQAPPYPTYQQPSTSQCYPNSVYNYSAQCNYPVTTKDYVQNATSTSFSQNVVVPNETLTTYKLSTKHFIALSEKEACKKFSHSESSSASRSEGRRSRRRSRSHSPRHRSPKRRQHYKHRRTSRTILRADTKSERDIILEKWRKDFCATGEEMSNKLEQLSKLSQEEILEREKSFWITSTSAGLFYEKDENSSTIVRGTDKLQKICEEFSEKLVLRASKINFLKAKYEPPQRKKRTRLCKHKSEPCNSDSSSNDDFSEEEEENIMEELNRKQQHPDRLHQEMWYEALQYILFHKILHLNLCFRFNDPGEMNDGPLCRCSLKSRKSGIRHGIYAGETHLNPCDKNSNNISNLYHYKITISPPTNFLTKTPTIIKYDEREFIFEGFSMFSHFPLVKLPICKVIRFNIEYTILYIEEKSPENFTIQELDLFQQYLFQELLELVDLDFHAAGDNDGCSQYHFMPRFVRDLPDNGREILSMKGVLQYLLDSSQLLIDETQLASMMQMSQYEWQAFADEVKGAS